MQTIAENAEYTEQPRKLLAAVRVALMSEISANVLGDNSELQALTLDAAVDFNFAQAELKGEQFSPDYLQVILTKCRESPELPLVCSSLARGLIAECLQQYSLTNYVVAYEELSPEVKIKSCFHISVKTDQKISDDSKLKQSFARELRYA